MELTEFELAVAEAKKELEGEAGQPAETDAPEEVLDDQASEDIGEQAVEPAPNDNAAELEATESEEEPFADLVPSAPPASALETATFVLPGIDKPIGLQELKDGYLRNADATKKWQSAAEQAKLNERAIGFWAAFEKDPEGVARTIAEASGLIEKGSAPVAAVDLSPLRSAEQVEAEIARRVQEAVAGHPTVQQAVLANARAWIASEFKRVEDVNGVKLGPKSRQAMLRKATTLGIQDLASVYDLLQAERGRKQAAANDLRNAAPAKRTARVVTREVDTPADSFEEAAQRAALAVANS